MRLYTRKLIPYEEALRVESSNPDDFALKVSGIYFHFQLHLGSVRTRGRGKSQTGRC